MAYAEYTIVNMALQRIGVDKITSAQWTTPTTVQQAIDAYACWEYIRDEVLSAKDWRFCKTRGRLERQELTPSYGYDYYYVMPWDFLRLAQGTKLDPSMYPTALQPTELPVGADRELATKLSKYSWKFETIPLETGVEKVTNGNFTGAATNWTLGTNWAYSSNNIVRTAHTSITLLSQAYGDMVSAPVVGERYVIEVDVDAIDAGELTPSLGGVTGDPMGVSLGVRRQFLGPATSATTGLVFTPTTIGMTCTLDSISVFKVEDRLVLCTDYEDSEDEPLYVQYIKKITDVTKWSPDFINALAWRLAQELSITLTEDKQKWQWCRENYRDAVIQAEAYNQHMDYLENEQGSDDWERAGR